MTNETLITVAANYIKNGAYTKAESALMAIIQGNRASANSWVLLAQTSVRLGKYNQGLFAAWQANQLTDTPEAHALFAYCLNHVAITTHDPQLQIALTRAVSETWGAPAELAEQACKLLKLDPLIQRFIAAPELTLADIQALNQHLLLIATLQSAPVCDLDLERGLTRLRCNLLLQPEAIQQAPQLGAALAQQCFINEYLYSVSKYEAHELEPLINASTSQIPTAHQILLLACYRPLYTLPGVEAWIRITWPDVLLPIIQQQITEPQAEAAIARSLLALTPIQDPVSNAVQAMYEDSPYPRWVRLPHAGTPQPLNRFLSQTYPRSGFIPLPNNTPLQALIGGGGTGQHPIHTARRFSDIEVQVIDLSRHSLAYAQRKAQAIGINNLHFAQADILQISQLPQNFDLIESVGVLHHMADPWVGWEALLSILKTNGVMKLGFYSQTARQQINRLRSFIKIEGLSNTPDAIRVNRQRLIEQIHAQQLDDILRLRDFYSVSACRDLLFHVQEHQLTLPEINAFLQAHQLRFLGFETDLTTLNTYRSAFPDDPSATNLTNWHQFEQRFPNTFISMYQFWVQKTS